MPHVVWLNNGDPVSSETYCDTIYEGLAGKFWWMEMGIYRELWKEGIEIFVKMSSPMCKNHAQIDKDHAKEFGSSLDTDDIDSKVFQDEFEELNSWLRTLYLAPYVQNKQVLMASSCMVLMATYCASF